MIVVCAQRQADERQALRTVKQMAEQTMTSHKIETQKKRWSRFLFMQSAAIKCRNRRPLTRQEALKEHRQGVLRSEARNLGFHAKRTICER